MTMETERDGEITFLKEELVLVPILGTAIAIAYDVGYFYGVDINLFTLFSISEHIVFALEALPLAITAAVLLGVLTSTENVVRAVADSASPKLRWAVTIGLAVTVIFALIVGGLSFLFGVLFGIVSGWFFRLITTGIVRSRFVIVAISSVLVLVFAFALGWTTSSTYLKRNDGRQQITTEDEVLSTNIIRSGDRGVLFVNVKSKRLGFLKWESIKRITANL